MLLPACAGCGRLLIVPLASSSGRQPVCLSSSCGPSASSTPTRGRRCRCGWERCSTQLSEMSVKYSIATHDDLAILLVVSRACLVVEAGGEIDKFASKSRNWCARSGHAKPTVLWRAMNTPPITCYLRSLLLFPSYLSCSCCVQSLIAIKNSRIEPQTLQWLEVVV